jgi:ABC-type lipoprotein release transport system permease subunit
MGVLGARWVAASIEGTLYGVDPLQPAVYAAAVTLFLLVAFVATAIPTRLATRVEPSVALRQE